MALRDQLAKIAPHFEKGGRLEKFYPVWEALDSFLMTTGERTSSGPHIRDGNDLKRTMMTVVVALVPCTLFGIVNIGVQSQLAGGASMATVDWLAAALQGLGIFLPIYVVTLAVGGTIETIFAVVRKHEINEGFLVTSLLFPLIMPPTIPLWQVGLGIAFGTLIGKEVFGGTGMNILNPALTGRAFLFFAYPAQISGDEVWVAQPEVLADGFSGATTLARFYVDGAGALSDVVGVSVGLDWWTVFLGFIPGSIGETSTLLCMVGALILVVSKVGSWRIMVGVLLGMIGMSTLLNGLSPTDGHYLSVPAPWHFVSGSFAFAMVFMATDPVSAAQTDTGRWIYGVLIGVFGVLVRVLNPAYPEGWMLSILFMNIFAPLIDHYVVRANICRREARLGL